MQNCPLEEQLGERGSFCFRRLRAIFRLVPTQISAKYLQIKIGIEMLCLYNYGTGAVPSMSILGAT
jgi:hypothetical protein